MVRQTVKTLSEVVGRDGNGFYDALVRQPMSHLQPWKEQTPSLDLRTRMSEARFQHLPRFRPSGVEPLAAGVEANS